VSLFFIYKPWNYLIVRRQNIFRNGKAHNPSEKMIVIIGWNSLNFHAFDALPNTQIFNTSNDIKHILQSILEFCLWSGWRHFVVYMDNATPHAARKSQMFCEANFLLKWICIFRTAQIWLRHIFSIIWDFARRELPSVQKRNSFSKFTKFWRKYKISHVSVGFSGSSHKKCKSNTWLFRSFDVISIDIAILF
jgi:hypothetical protein